MINNTSPFENELDDVALVKRTQQGDEAAFNILIHRYQSVISSIAAHYASRDEVDDIIQEIFLTAWRNVSFLKDRDKFKEWLTRLAQNKAIDFLRRRQRLLRTSADIITAYESPSYEPVTQFEDSIEIHELLEQLRRLLTEKHYYCFVLKMYGYTNEEIGVRVGIHASSVPVYVSKAQQKVREVYAQMKRDGDTEVNVGAGRIQSHEQVVTPEKALPSEAIIHAFVKHGSDNYIKMFMEMSQAEVAGFINELQEPYLTPMQLHYLEHLTANDIAIRLGRPKGTIKSLISRGTEQIRKRKQPEPVARTAESEASCIQDATDIEAVAEQLSVSCRTVLEMHYLEKLSFSDIAKQLDMPEGTVKSHVSRGKKIITDYKASQTRQ